MEHLRFLGGAKMVFAKSSMAIAVALIVGLVLGAITTNYLIGHQHSFWFGKGAEWAQVLVGTVAAVATLIAIVIGMRTAKQAIESERQLRNEEAAAAMRERRRRAKLHSAIVNPEIWELLVRAIAWQKMLADVRFTLEEMYEHIESARCSAVDAAMDHIDEFEVRDGFDLAMCLNAYKSLRVSAATNRRWMTTWPTEKRDTARGKLLRDISIFEERCRKACDTTIRLSGLTTGGTPEQLAEDFFETQLEMLSHDQAEKPAASAQGAE